MSTPTAPRGPCNWGDGPLVLLPSADSPLNVVHVANSSSGNTSTSTSVFCCFLCVLWICAFDCICIHAWCVHDCREMKKHSLLLYCICCRTFHTCNEDCSYSYWMVAHFRNELSSSSSSEPCIQACWKTLKHHDPSVWKYGVQFVSKLVFCLLGIA